MLITMKNKAAQELAQKRHLSLSPDQRKKIAKKAAKARWDKARKLSTGETFDK